VTRDCQVRDQHGHTVENLYALGPLTRGIFLETVAVPHIRKQAAAIAARLTKPADAR
jgi:uncharacterized NAD(P)/FAD-binding protein YdhS